MKNTTLWHVGIIENPTDKSKHIVAASREPLPAYKFYSHMRIRAITGRAAARRFIRGNLCEILANSDDEPWNHRYDRPTTKPVLKENRLCVEIMGAIPEYVTIIVY